MSEIFYSELDPNLKLELNERAIASRNKDVKHLDYMLGKVANAKYSAYEGADATNRIFTLGGKLVRGKQYQPGGESGFLSDKGDSRTDEELDWVVTGTGNSKTVTQIWTSTIKNVTNNRIPPYLSSANIAVGDHSMGLLNTATVVIEVPNPDRDLDVIERIFMRPGRYVKLEIEYPPSAVITGLFLSPSTIPNADKLKELYPKANIEEKQAEIAKMNHIAFEGLITSFSLTYQTDYTAQIQVEMRGTSNVLPDITAIINAKNVDENATKKTENPIATPAEYKASIQAPKNKNELSFYRLLLDDIDTTLFSDQLSNRNRGLAQLLSGNNTLLIGSEDSWVLSGNAYPSVVGALPTDTKTYNRYITLGYLIKFINKYVTTKLTGVVANPNIICSNAICYGTLYPNIVSSDPLNVLLMPRDISKKTTETYGLTTFYEFTKNADFPGFLGNDRAYPAMIFLNLKMINTMLLDLAKSNTSFKISDFLQQISSKIKKCTGGGYSMSLITHPKDQKLLLFYDETYLGQPAELDTVKAYPIPMSAKVPISGVAENNPIGSIVHDFKLTAKLPDSATTLSYVLNQDPDNVSENEIAPYVNLMYSFGDKEKAEKAVARFSKIHLDNLDILNGLKSQYGNNIIDETIRTKLEDALAKHLMYPFAEIKKSQQATAPIFPWDASFTIDGINGFRYGDIVTFEVLPERYRVNTVFSVIGVNHDLSQDGQWKTEIKCIMRPKIGAIG